ncbi:MAG: hypothetical protein AAGD06_04910 [Acidobacteriota bacterium]
MPITSLADEAESSNWKDRFQLHGHLTTSYADSSPSGAGSRFAEEAQIGIPEDGTFDYRVAALQLRYTAAADHTFLVQLSHRSLGDSVLDEVTDEVELDWLFWQWQVGESTRLRVGRFPTPAGIFNEIRDVGTLLPFFRPSFNFYREGSIFSETTDGIGVSHRFNADSEWAVDADLYYGEYDVIEQDTGLGNEIVEVGVDNAIGGQMWLNTPVEGLRIGLGGLRWDVGPESQFNLEEATWESWYASIDGSFERYVARAEYRQVQTPFVSLPFIPSGQADLDIYYWQLGWRPTPKLAFYLQSEFSEFEQTAEIYVGGSTQLNNRRDDGVAVNYFFRPNVVLKAEYHEQAMDAVQSEPIFLPEGLRLQVNSERFENDYSVLSLSVSF